MEQKPLIYITRKIPEEILKPYEDQFQFQSWSSKTNPVPKEILMEAVENADGLLTLLTDRIDANLLRQARSLKMIANMAVGYDNIDLHAAKKHKVIVTNTPDVLTETTADLTFALLLATARRVVEAYRFIENNKWKHWSPFLLAGTDVYKRTIGIVGMGRIGEAVARRAKGFGMSILYHNRTRNERAEEDLQATYVSFEELLQRSDFVVSLVPLSEETRHMFNQKAFKLMKSSALFINVSRGEVVDEKALYQALISKEIKAAGLDVFHKEPIDASHPFMQLKNVVCLPHIGSASRKTRKDMLELCLRNLEGYFYGDGPITPIL